MPSGVYLHKRGGTHIGTPHTKEWKENARQRFLGDKNPAKNILVRKKLSEIGKLFFANHPEEKIKRGNINRGRVKTPEQSKKQSDAQRGKHRSLETREKMRKSMIGKNIGKHHTEESKRKISLAETGSKSHFWIDGRTPENIRIRHSIDTSLWRNAVFFRDNYVCQKCRDYTKKKLNAHHIKNFSSFPELRFAIDNGITLCEDCHKEFHRKYGERNNTPEQLNEFLNKI